MAKGFEAALALLSAQDSEEVSEFRDYLRLLRQGWSVIDAYEAIYGEFPNWLYFRVNQLLSRSARAATASPAKPTGRSESS